MTTEKLLQDLDEEKLREKSLHDRIDAISSIYLVMFEIDVINDTFREFKSKSYVNSLIDFSKKTNCQEQINNVMTNLANDETRPAIMDFINFSTLNERLAHKNTITQEFQGTVNAKIWARARFIVIDRLADGSVSHVLWLVESIDAEKKEKERLQKEAEISEAASKAKSTFLANMSHEIRTPINAILGMNEMILRESNINQIFEYAENIKAAGNVLLSIVNDILDFSKVEAGKMEIIPQQYDLSAIIVELVNMIKPRAEDKNLEFNVDINQNIPRELYGDNIRIRQCILNLLTNAVKYTQKGHVTFTITFETLEDNYINLIIRVADTGIGINKEDLKKIFYPFDRVDEERNKTIEGTGLGLSIVQSLLKQMESELEIKTEYNVGSEFSFKLKQKVMSSEKIGDIKHVYESAVKVEKYKELLHAPDAKLLFVDDTQMNLDVCVGLLKKTQIKVDTATSGMAALQKVCDKQYHIIFIDHRMPQMDGIETLEAMKHLPENLNNSTPCIALTANAISGSREMYLKSGFTDYLPKPINPEKLEKIIRKYLPQDLILTDYEEEMEQSPEEVIKDEDLPQLEGIDVRAGLNNCGDFNLLKQMFCQFHDTIDQKSEEIQSYLNENNYLDYKIKVHALKSTSRLIGAIHLSEMAEFLEHAAESEKIDFIKENTPDLLEKYRLFKDILKDYTEKKEVENNNPLISQEELEKNIKALIQAVEDYNYDELENIQKNLNSYKLPLDFSSIYDKINTCIYNVDFDGLNDLIPEIQKIQEGE